MFPRLQRFVYSGALALAGLQCKSSNPTPSQTPDDYATGSAATPQGEAAKAKSGEAASAKSGAAASAKHGDAAALSDAEIVAITAAANSAEIEQGRLAREKAKDPRVRDYAAMMVDHHAEALAQQRRSSIEPRPNADAQRLQDDAKDALASLQQKSGNEFDQAYLQLQIDEHRQVLKALQDELLPAVQNARLQAYLRDIKARVESHLAQAERLQQEMASTSQNEQSDNKRPLISNTRGSAARLSNR